MPFPVIWDKHCMWHRAKGNETELFVTIASRASRSEVAGIQEDRLRLRIAAPPVDGKANEEIVAFVSKLLGVPKRSVCISKGESSKQKTLVIAQDYAALAPVLLKLGESVVKK